MNIDLERGIIIEILDNDTVSLQHKYILPLYIVKTMINSVMFNYFIARRKILYIKYNNKKLEIYDLEFHIGYEYIKKNNHYHCIKQFSKGYILAKRKSNSNKQSKLIISNNPLDFILYHKDH